MGTSKPILPAARRPSHGKQPKANRQHRWNDRMVASTGYIRIRVGRGHPLADPNGYAYEHTVVWVSAGNPKPGRGQVLKHKNDVKTDSRIDNLELLARAELNRRKNQKHLRDPRGRLLTATASSAIRAGGTVRYHFMDKT